MQPLLVIFAGSPIPVYVYPANSAASGSFSRLGNSQATGQALHGRHSPLAEPQSTQEQLLQQMPPAPIVPWAAQPDKGHLKRRLVLQWSACHECGAGALRRGEGRGRPGSSSLCSGNAPGTPGPGTEPSPGSCRAWTQGGLACPLPGSGFLQLLGNCSHKSVTKGHWSPPFPRWRSWPRQGWAAGCQAGHAPRDTACEPLPSQGRSGRGGVSVCASHDRERREAHVPCPAIRWKEQSVDKVGHSGGLLLRWSPAPVQSSCRQMVPWAEHCHLRGGGCCQHPQR